jgi:hypothetical protein
MGRKSLARPIRRRIVEQGSPLGISGHRRLIPLPGQGMTALATNRKTTKGTSMKSKEIFALVIRIVGILGLISVIHHLVEDLTREDHQQPAVYFAKKIAYLLVGFYFVWGAPHLVKFAYSGEPKS